MSRHKEADPEGPEYTDLRASANGVLSYEGVVFDGRTVFYAPKPGAPSSESCGWSDGGSRVKGPRGG